MFCSLLFGLALGILLYKIFVEKEPRPINGIYRKPGKWYYLKLVVFYVLIRLRQRKSKRNKATSQSGIGNNSILTPVQLDAAQALSDHPKAFDAVFFVAANRDGYYLIISAERRRNQIVNGLFYILIPGIGLLRMPRLPDSVLFNANGNEFGAEGILLTPEVPMIRWKLQYKGKMRAFSNPDSIYDVELDAVWTSTLPYFDIDTDCHPLAVSRSIAKEIWTRDYFTTLEKSHQVHYEQMGSLVGVVQVNSNPYNLLMPSFRDHSFGRKRDWSLMHRYIFHMFFMEDGTKVSVGVFSQPCTNSTLELGMVATPWGEVHPIKWCDLQLHTMGEEGTPPNDYAFSFEAGGRVYLTSVRVIVAPCHYVGWDWEVKMIERFVEVTIDNVKGNGVIEWCYRHRNGRPESCAKMDPQWFAEVRREYLTC